MKAFFWFAVVLLLFLTFSGKEPIKPYRDAMLEQLMVLLPESWQTENKDLRVLQQELTVLGNSLGQGQRELLAKAAKDQASALQFRQRYCVDKDFNPILFGEPLRKSCEIVDQFYYRLDGI